jgi:MFS family permease
MYAIAFVFSLSSAIPTYINSTFLAQFMGDKFVGIIYTASSLLTIAAFIEMPGIIRRFGNFNAIITLIFLEIFSLVGLSIGKGTLAIISSFIVNFVCIALISYTLDIFLEELSPNSRTGHIRGTYLTIANTAWLMSPLIGSAILGENAYNNVYAVSGILLMPVMALAFFNLGGIKEANYSRSPFWKSFGEVWSDKNIKGILFIQFLLQFFYGWMIIYTPIYLHEVIGFKWDTLGLIFTIMLLPFVLLEAPLGRLADKNGEKKLLSVGFAIMAISTFLIAFVTDHNVYIWTALLFVTRIGAAIVEVMTDTYFFKKVDATKTHIISFFRTARPLAYVISPVIATILFTVFDTRGLFVFLGLFLLYGLRYSYSIDDVKS